MNLLAFAARRLAEAVVLLVLLSAAVFAATAVLPGDAVSAVAGVDASETQRAEVRAELGLDRPAVQRYADWAAGAVRGIWAGASWGSGRSPTCSPPACPTACSSPD